MATAPSTLSVIRIHSEHRWPDKPFHALWNRRSLVYLLARREVQLRYQHAAAGMGWAIFQPLVTMAVLTVFQAFMGKPSSGAVPYPVYAVAGIVPWTFVVHAMTQASNSLLKYFDVINKVYFPRLALPLAAVLGGAVDFLIALALIPVAMLYFHISPGFEILFLPVFMLQTIVLATALGVWLAALNTRFRDTANALPLITQLWFFLTPIAYTSDAIPEQWRLVFGLNPMCGVLEGFRWSLFGTAETHLTAWVAMSWVTTTVLLVTGVLFFLAGEETLTDIL